MLKRLILLLAGIGLWIGTGCEPAQENRSVELITSLDTTYATIGDVVHLNIKLLNGADKQIVLNDWVPDPAMEVRSYETGKKGNDFWGDLELVFWDTGRIEIPSIQLQLLDEDSTITSTIQSEPLDIQIASILERNPSLKMVEKSLRPLKDPVPVSRSLDAKQIALISLLLLIFGTMVFLWFKRISPQEEEWESSSYIEEADRLAIRRLEALEEKALWMRGRVKEHYVDLSQILREYVENSLYLRCLEMTTEEIKSSRAIFPYSDQEFDEFHTFLQRADMTKFAKHIPELKTCGEDLQSIRNFITRTRIYWKQIESVSQDG